MGLRDKQQCVDIILCPKEGPKYRLDCIDKNVMPVQMNSDKKKNYSYQKMANK